MNYNHQIKQYTAESLYEWREDKDKSRYAKPIESVIPNNPRPMLRVYLPKDTTSIEVSTIINIPMGTLATRESIHAYVDNLSKRWVSQVEKQVRDMLWPIEDQDEWEEEPF